MRQNFPRHYLAQECGEFTRGRGESQDVSVPSGLGRTCCCNRCSADLSGLRADLLFGSQSSVGGASRHRVAQGPRLTPHPPQGALCLTGADVALAISVYIHLARQGSVTCPTNRAGREGGPAGAQDEEGKGVGASEADTGRTFPAV